MPLKILIADDHGIVRQGIRMLIERRTDMTVIGETGDGRRAITMAAELSPDVTIMDIAMPELNGIEATKRICGLKPGAKVIILSMHHTSEHVFVQ